MALRPADPLPPPSPALATEVRGHRLLRRREDHDAGGVAVTRRLTFVPAG